MKTHDAQHAMHVSEIPLKDALAGPDPCEWKDAIYSEIKCLLANDTWEIIEKPAGVKVIGCRIVLRNKYNPEGAVPCSPYRVSRIETT